MKPPALPHFLACALFLLLAGCYPKVKVIAKWPDGKPKFVRHTKRHNRLKEKLVGYYDNGKKESVTYWNSDLDPYKETTWYDNGTRKSLLVCHYKDTNRTLNSADSVYIFLGLIRYTYTTWYKNGKTQLKVYTDKGKKIREQYNEKGICVQLTHDKTVRPDNYDTVLIRKYRGVRTRTRPSGFPNY